MPRWMTRLSPLSRSASRYFARRHSRFTCARSAACEIVAERDGADRRAAVFTLVNLWPSRRGHQAQPHGLDFGQFGHPGPLSGLRNRTVAQRSAQAIVPRMTDTPTPASFGFREVPEDQKEGLVREVFSSVARRYDLMNDLMSRRRPPAVEGRHGRMAKPAARLAGAGRGGRHRRHRVPHRRGRGPRRRGGRSRSATSMPTCWAKACAAPAKGEGAVAGSAATPKRCRFRTPAWTPIRSPSASET